MSPSTWIIALTLSTIAGLADVIGGLVVAYRAESVSGRTLLYSTAASAGFMLGVSLLDRIPDAFHKGSPASMATYVLIGFLLVYLIESLVPGHHHDHNHSDIPEERPLMSHASSLAAQWGLMIHTALDGVAIGAGFAQSRQIGLLMFLAVIFHKVPEGFSLASVVLASGRGRGSAIKSVLGIGLTTVVGTIAALGFSRLEDSLPQVLLAIATGSFLYISTCSLLAGTMRGNDCRTPFCVLGGVLLFVLSFAFLRAVNLE